MRCRARRALQNPEPVYTQGGRAATRGTCPVCGAALFRMGRSEAHAGMEPPPPAPRQSGEGRSRRRGKASPPASSPRRGEGRLVIVESPAKARTVGRFLGRGYPVRASVGHVRDLPKSSLGVDVENDFAPHYRVLNDKREVVKSLRAEAEKAAEVYLATDPDREGEAIAWHLVEAMQIDRERVRRVVFHEITKDAVDEAFAHPTSINMDLVNAQQARRVLDRLVGYKLSPLLWRKVRGGLSAGRVQSVAVRLVVEREREIERFVPEEFWSIEAELAKREERRPPRSFLARLWRIRGKEVDLKNEAQAHAVVADLEGAVYAVAAVKRGERRRNPAAPFTTSTLQQEASRRLRMAPRRTMAVAQQLYEGIDLPGEGSVGLITYMRTDSTNVSEQAQAEARAYVIRRFGEDYVPARPPVYKTRAKKAQEAHEAIRPTSVLREPEAIKEHLSREQQRLYQLIWQRFVASQMAAAVYDTTTGDVLAGAADGEKPYLFRANGSTLRFPGFLAVYEEARDEDAEEEAAQQIPPLSVGELLDLLRLIPKQHFTQPPPRYTEATLVKALEELGIGRPSTYATILSTIQERGYVRQAERRLVPTETGFVVNDMLVENFPTVLDYGFTAQMEEDLDRVAAGEQGWVPVVRAFYGPFEERLGEAEKRIARVEASPQEVGRDCPECGRALVVRQGRFGKFIACSGYPACRYREPWLEKTGAVCPRCGSDLVEKRTRKGRVGYGCASYPRCEFWVWQRPLPQPCPACGGLLVEGRKGQARCSVCGVETALNELPEEKAKEE